MKRFARNGEGAAIIEFALVFPIFLILLFGILEYGIVLFLRSTVEETTRNTARMAITGQRAGAGTRDENLSAALRQKLEAVVFDPDRLSISTTFYDSYDALSGSSSCPAGDLGCVTVFGSANQVVEYRVAYDYEFLTPLAALLEEAVGGMDIVSTVFAQNEDF